MVATTRSLAARAVTSWWVVLGPTCSSLPCGDSTPEARDMIRDFSKADGDKIDLTFTANHFHDGNSFTGASGEVIAVGRLVQIDIDGDRVADMEIDMRSDLGLTADDFILTFGFEMF